MKILFIHHSPLGAFGEAAMHYYPASLARLGHEVVMVAPAGGDSGFFVGSDARIREVAADESWLSVIRRIAAEEQPEIVHVYLYSGCGLVPFYVRSVCPHSRFVMDIRSPLLRTGIMRLLHRLKNLFEPLFFDAIAAHGIESAWTQIGRKKNIYWIPPGVEISAIPAQSELQHKRNDSTPCRFVYIGSLDVLRRVHLMVEAFIVAVGKRDITLDIFGDGNLKNKLEKVVSERGLDDRIFFKGKVNRNELLTVLPSYDVGLAYIPSGIYSTAPALKTLEYLACGLPVLATDTFGNRMFVKDGNNGRLVDVSVEGYAKGISDIAGSSDLVKMRKAARTSVEAFDWQRLTEERLLPMYEAVLTRNA